MKKITLNQNYELQNKKVVQEPISKTPFILLLLFVASAFAWSVTNINLVNFYNRFNNFFTILISMTSPRWAYFEQAIGPMIDTIQMSFLGSLIGALLALPVAFLSAGNITKNKWVLSSTRFILSLIRTLPVLIYAAILSLAFGFGVFPGTVAIAIFTFGILSKMLYENIETIDLSAYDAIEATGATKSKSFIAAILPQIFPSYLSFSLYSFEINIRFAAILGYVGAGGIGILFDNRMAWRRYEDVAVLILMLFVVVLSIESLSRYFRKRLA